MSASTTQTAKKWRMYQREGNPDTPMRLQDRDSEILYQVARYRLSDATILLRLLDAKLADGLTERPLQGRLTRLFRNGYLHRLPGLEDGTPGKKHPLYALTNKGARHLLERDYLPVSQSDFDENNRTLKDNYYLRHTLAVAAFMTAIEAHCYRSESVSFISQAELTGEPETAVSLKVQARDKQGHAHRAVPDQIFGLCYHHLGDRTAYYYLEVDRGTEQQRYNAKRPTKTTIEGKIAAYLHAFDGSKNYVPLGLPNFRVLFLTTKREQPRLTKAGVATKNRDRLRGLLETYERVTGGLAPNVFLFARFDPAQLNQVLEQAWLNGKGESFTLDGLTMKTRQV